MSSYRYRIINAESGEVQLGIVHEWPESEDEIKRKLFEDALEQEGFILEEFEKMWIN